MKLTTGILAIAMMTAGAWAQNPDAIDNARSIAKSLQQKQANDTNAALQAAGVPQTKPVPGAPSKPSTAAATKPAGVPASKSAPTATPVKPVAKGSAPVVKPKTVEAKSATPVNAGPKTAQATGPAPKQPFIATPQPAASAAGKPSADAPKQPKPEDKKWSMSGKRDPFFSPVVQQAGGSGCSSGKKCLEIGQINVRGVVKSESGFIAVVTNNMNKAYFLRENDPVFNGYVVRITGDSVVFQETVQDKLGKPFTREVVKRLFTPAV
jgi:Tfp pilus assembly protein PilP